MSSISSTEKVQEIAERISPSYGQSIDVDEGWYPIVISCYEKLCEIDPDHAIFQVKEKFGGLRYYFSTTLGGDALGKMSKIVADHEEIAAKTCEITGKPGVLMQKNGLYKTLSEEFQSQGWKTARSAK